MVNKNVRYTRSVVEEQKSTIHWSLKVFCGLTLTSLTNSFLFSLFFPSPRSTSCFSRLDLVQCQQPEPLNAGCRAGSVQENPPPPPPQRDCHPAQCRRITRSSEGESSPGGETTEPGPKTLLWIWCVWCVSCSGCEASGDGGLSAALYRREWKSGSPWSPNTESVLSEQRLSEWTLTGALPSKPSADLTLTLGPLYCPVCSSSFKKKK